MQKTIVLALNPLDPSTWTKHEVDDVCEFALKQFDEWPATARIYHNEVSEANDVTPRSNQEIERLRSLDGHFYLIVYPGNPLYILYAVVALIVVAAIVFRPQVPSVTNRNAGQSPNNELAERTNKPRVNGRIPDIYGTVRSTPDLIAVPYKLFIEHQEVEYAYMCVGRGEYDVSDIRDDTTLISDIAGSSVEVYGPNTSPNSASVPQLRIGSPINEPIITVARSNSVNGQVLRPPNDKSFIGSENVAFASPNVIRLFPGEEYDFTEYFETGDTLNISNASVFSSYDYDSRQVTTFNDGSFQFQSEVVPSHYSAGLQIELVGATLTATDADGFVIAVVDLSGSYTIESSSIVNVSGVNYCKVKLKNATTVNPQWLKANTITSATNIGIRVPSGSTIFNLDGVYEILTVNATEISLSSPASVNPGWSSITTTEYTSPVLSTSGAKWVGPFVLDSARMNRVFANFVALNGLYKDDGENQQSMNVDIEIEVTPINSDGSTRGNPETFQATIEGSATLHTTRAVTLKAMPTFTGRCSVRARRVSPSDLDYKGNVVDEIKWRDIYAVSPVEQKHFGNVTTVQSITFATNGALAIKERKLNMLVTRKLPSRITGELIATNNAADIISAICLDPRIGNRKPSEIDFDSVYDTIESVAQYFGTELAAEFNYTFDSDNLSFEETITTIAQAVFCTAYRRGNVIKLSFERESEDSVLLFNHRNKIPGSETRSVSFGNQDDYDGIAYSYIDPTDDALVTYYIPEDQSAVNAKEIESVGVRSRLQAHFHAWREWNKIKYQNVTVEFQATQEADMLTLNDRIIVADNTRPDTQDGEVIEQSGLLITLSQPVDFTKYRDYRIFLQNYDGSVQSMPVRPGGSPYQVLLTESPRLPLATADDLYARATYAIVGNTSPRETAFLLAEKEPQSNFTATLRAINYNSHYYDNDRDYIDGLINADGEAV